MNKEVEYWQRQYRILVFGILIMALLFMILIFLQPKPSESKVCYNMASFNETLDKINKNCGGTFITKQYRSNDWSVFQSNVCDGKKCESKYVPLDECISADLKDFKYND